MKKYLADFGRDFWLFRAGQLISSIGDGCAGIAFMWWLLEKSGSPEKMALVLAPVSFARIFLIPLMGPIGDRYSRRSVVIVSDVWRGLMFLILAILVRMDFFSVPVLTVLFVLTTAGTALFTTVSGSIVAQLVDKKDLPAALESSNTIVAVGTLAGGLIGSVAVNYFGVLGAFLINAASFFLAAAASFYVRSRLCAAAERGGLAAGGAFKEWVAQLANGFKVVAGIPLQFWICVLLALINFAASPLSMALPVLVKDSKTFSPGFIGIMSAAMGAGTIIGSLLAGWLCKKMFADVVIFGGLCVIGLGMAALFLAPGMFGVISIMTMLGAAIMLVNVPLNIRLMNATPDNYRSRVGSVSAFMSQAASPLGLALSGMAVAEHGMRATMMLAGGGIILMAPLIFLVPQFSAFCRLRPEDTGDFFLNRHPEVFCKA